MTRSGESPPSMIAFSALATATPGSLPPRSPVAYTLVAPCSPSAPAIADASPPTMAVTLPPPAVRLRALVSSSREPVVAAPLDSCAKTQMFMLIRSPSSRSDDFQIFQERHDLGVGLAVVLDDLARLASLGLGDVDDLLSGAGPTDRRDTQVAGGHRVDRLRLGGHDALEAWIPRLDHTSRDADQRRKRARHLVVALLRLAIDLQRAAVDDDTLGEGDRWQTEQLGHLLRHGARVAI